MQRQSILSMFCSACLGASALSCALKPSELEKVERRYHASSLNLIEVSNYSECQGFGVVGQSFYSYIHPDDPGPALPADLPIFRIPVPPNQ